MSVLREAINITIGGDGIKISFGQKKKSKLREMLNEPPSKEDIQHEETTGLLKKIAEQSPTTSHFGGG